MKSYLLYLYAESPLHAGAPNSDEGIDLPIQRETATRYPVIWGPSLKGALRRFFREHANLGKEDLINLFGSEPPGASPADTKDGPREMVAGEMAVGDAQLVALPVPTLQKTFAWVTSELALGRLSRKYRRLSPSIEIPDLPILRMAESGLAIGAPWVYGGNNTRDEVLGPCVVSLDDVANASVQSWAARIRDDVFGAQPEKSMVYFAEKLSADLLVVGDSTMALLLRECMEHSVRIQLNADAKTVNHGPFTSEYLPTDTVLAATLTVRSGSALDGDLLRAVFNGATWQVGGDETLGKGLVWSQIVEGTA